MGKIVLLDDLTINKIAAGEVIERPASAVKEMCENSIDSGAKNVTVEIKNGGISLIRIIDDGSGIAEDDMKIAFERHATSKIRNADDLLSVKTMGFRGEALASIAAISNVEMVSKRPEDEIGHRIVVEGGKVLEEGECASPNGTTITVKNLFFNTPVRYKFLKKDFTESGYIEDAITRLALINKDVSFKLINTGKTAIQTIGNGDIKSVIYSIYGKDVSSGVTEIDYTYEDIRVTGVVGNSSIARSNRNGQIYFINNRYVKDKTLTSAVDQAYSDILPSGRYGFVVLNLEIDQSKVDCNVHPAKLEVRFEDEQKVFRAIYHAIKSRSEEISVKTPKYSEIENQEKIEEKVESSENNPQNSEEIVDNDVEEKDEYKPRTGTFSGFFKKFMSEKEPEVNEFDEEDKPTLIEDIFEARRKGGLNWDNFEADLDKENEEEPKSEEKSELKISETPEAPEKLNIPDKKEVEKPREVKLGNTIISSDTRESDYDVTDLIKAKSETIEVDMGKMFSANDSKTEVIKSLKEVEEEKNRETAVIGNIEKVENNGTSEKNEEPKVEEIEVEESGDFITERIIEQKVKSNMEDTQFIDTGKVRQELYKDSKDEEEVPMTNEFANMYKKVFGTEVQAVRKTKEENDAKLDLSSNIQFVQDIKNETVFKDKSEDKPKIDYKYVGTIFENYAVIEVKDEMYMIEKSAAEERLMYEVVKKNFYNDEVNDSVSLLLADIVTLSQKEMTMSRDLLPMFQKSGFDYEEFGEYTIKLTKVPSWAEELNTKKLFLEILREMDTVAVTATEEKEEKFIATVASKYVELAETVLTEKELEDLIKRLLELDSPFMYPNGRLTAVKITKANMEKKFSRR